MEHLRQSAQPQPTITVNSHYIWKEKRKWEEGAVTCKGTFIFTTHIQREICVFAKPFTKRTCCCGTDVTF